MLLSLAAALQVQTALPGQVAALRDLRRMATAMEAKLAELFVLLKGLRRG